MKRAGRKWKVKGGADSSAGKNWIRDKDTRSYNAEPENLEMRQIVTERE